MGVGRDGLDPARNPRRVVEARVVGEAELGQDLVGPGRIAVDGERRRPVAERADPRDLLDQLTRGSHVLAERIRALRVHPLVREPVARDLVPSSGHLPNDVRVVPRRHAEDEERRGHAQLLEQLQDSGGLLLERGMRPVPALEPVAAADELVPVLEVDAEDDRPDGVGWRGRHVGEATPPR